MQSILRVFDIFTTRERKYCVFLVLCMVLGAIFEAVGISVIFPLISILGDEHFLEKHLALKKFVEAIGITSHVSFIISTSFLMIIWYVLKNLYMVWIVRKQVAFSMDHQISFAKNLLALYLSKPYLYHLEQNTAILLRNIQSSVVIVFMNMFVSVFSLFAEVITAFVIWLMLLYIDPFTAIVVAGVIGFIIYSVMKTVRRNLAKQGVGQNHYMAELTRWLNQGLGAIKETKVLRKEEYFLTQFSRSYEKYGEAQKYYTITNQLPRFFVEAAVTIGLLVLIITKLYLGSAPQEIVPLLGVLALAAFRLMPCANRIINYSNGIKYCMPTFDAIYQDFMEIKQKSKALGKFDDGQAKREIAFVHHIEVEDVYFQYPKGEPVLKQLNLRIPRGCFVGIIGPSGAGKTTFVDILLGLLEPTRGKIMADGRDIFHNIRSWQSMLSYVPQSIYLIDGTIKENIAMGIALEEIDDKRILKSLQMAELYDFVQSLPEGLETRVGERGAKLSGGQRQRIGIARALYQEPEILILDEATSALDNETEKSITDTILKLKGDITIIAIAHRVTTLENCDFKIKFDCGKCKII